MTDLNSGKDWSDMDLSDLDNAVKRGVPVEEIAEFLMRDGDEVQAKIAELSQSRPHQDR